MCLNILAIFDFMRHSLILVFILAFFVLKQISFQPYSNNLSENYSTFSKVLISSTLIFKLFSYTIHKENLDTIISFSAILLNALFMFLILIKVIIIYLKKNDVKVKFMRKKPYKKIQKLNFQNRKYFLK